MAESDSDSGVGATPSKNRAKKTKILFEAWVADPCKIDLNIFRRWTQGYDEKETVKKEYPNEKEKQKTSLQHVLDQYRTFFLLEDYLRSPLSLSTQHEVQLHPSVIKPLAELYFSVSSDLLREVMGKKLTKTTTTSAAQAFGNQLSPPYLEYNEKTSMRSQRRQYDNIRYVYKRVVHFEKGTDIVEEVKKQFLLSDELANKYVYIVFMCFHRFESGKKRLNFLLYSDYEYMVSVIIKNWTTPLDDRTGSKSLDGHRHKMNDRSGLELDASFAEYVRDLKPLLLSSRKDETLEVFLNYIMIDLRRKPEMDSEKIKKIKSKFIVFFKALLTIGGNLSQAKEFKDFFVDIERATELLKGIEQNDVRVLFASIATSFQRLLDNGEVKVKHKSRLIEAWTKFIEGLRLCIACVLKARATNS